MLKCDEILLIFYRGYSWNKALVFILIIRFCVTQKIPTGVYELIKNYLPPPPIEKRSISL